jgi:hypothetical protein
MIADCPALFPSPEREQDKGKENYETDGVSYSVKHRLDPSQPISKTEVHLKKVETLDKDLRNGFCYLGRINHCLHSFIRDIFENGFFFLVKNNPLIPRKRRLTAVSKNAKFHPRTRGHRHDHYSDRARE